MRITKIRTRQVDIPLPESFHPAGAPGRVETQIRLAYVRIDTDAGVAGIAGHEFFGAEEQCVQHVYQQTLKQPLKLDNGMVQLPQGPGLGVDLQDWIFD